MTTSESHFEKVLVGNVPVSAINFDELVQDIETQCENGRYFAFVNAKSIVDADENPEYANSLAKSWINSPDGMPVAKLVGWKLGKKQERVSGPDVFEYFMNQKSDLKHFILGSTPAVLDRIVSKSQANIVGIYSPPFGVPSPSDLQHWSSMISKSSATHVWVGLGAPKQDMSGMELATDSGLSVLGVGAAFDFYTGNVVRAPRFIQRFGLEWLHRFLMNPKEMYQRYLFGGFKLLKIMSR
jgi:N-acetylglucosaminyldiphosphoundecaprenol N-acetyl-beta-D-mannosaminyltransferase